MSGAAEQNNACGLVEAGQLAAGGGIQAGGLRAMSRMGSPAGPSRRTANTQAANQSLALQRRLTCGARGGSFSGGSAAGVGGGPTAAQRRAESVGRVVVMRGGGDEGYWWGASGENLLVPADAGALAPADITAPQRTRIHQLGEPLHRQRRFAAVARQQQLRVLQMVRHRAAWCGAAV